MQSGSGFQGSGLQEAEHKFKLWMGVLAVITGLILINCIFISVVLICKRCRRKKGIRYIYQTRPKKSEPTGMDKIIS